MNKTIFLLLLLFLCVSSEALAEGANRISLPNTYRYRLSLKDKGGSPYSISRPEEFLSPKSIERRKRMGLAVDEYDLPISPKYLEAIRETGARVVRSGTIPYRWKYTILYKRKSSGRYPL